MRNILQGFIFLMSLLLFSCKKNDGVSVEGKKINFIFRFDSTQARLDGFGNPAPVAAGRAAQSPRFNKMSAHYLELTPDQFTALGSGQVLYHTPETTAGGSRAIDFSQSIFAGNNETFLSVPVKSFTAGTYNWLRVSLAYQNYNVWVKANGFTIDGTIASFIGYNTYINNYKIKDSTVAVQSNKLQGYWAFEAAVAGFGFVQSGQAPPGATTVPNPLFASSPVPAGSCVVTGKLANPLVITGNETADINIIVSLSVNKSFEWVNADGNTSYDPLNGDAVVDMGIRGMIPFRQ
ncbi:MAG: hypothetical protein WAT19_05435 [Ferruginibacter sp.]